MTSNLTTIRTLTQQETSELGSKVQLLYEIHSKTLSDEALALWMESLTPTYSPATIVALKAGCREKWFPGLGWVMEVVATAQRREREDAAMLVMRREMDESRRRLESMSAEEIAAERAEMDAIFAKMRNNLGIK